MGTMYSDRLIGQFFADSRHLEIFSDMGRLQRWLDVEAALAMAQARLGLIPQDAAETIAAASKAELFDLAELRSAIADTQHPIVPVVRQLMALCGPAAGPYVHYGATTQDIMDSGQSLQVRDSLTLITGDIDGAIEACRALGIRGMGIPIAGRTHGQQAVPISVALKVATWLDELKRARQRFDEAWPRIMSLQLWGAAGSMAAYGPRALEVAEDVGQRLGLTVTSTPWHASRDRVAEIATVCSFVLGAALRIANEVISLQSTEINEMHEPLTAGHVGSSTMPQKRNPHLSELLVAKVRIAFSVAELLTRNADHLHERDMATWAVEWVVVPELLSVTGAVAADLRHLLAGIEIRSDNMRANLALSGGQISAEALMMRMSTHVGRDTAHEMLISLTRKADAIGEAFVDVAAADAELRQHLSETEIRSVLQPENHMGQSDIVARRMFETLE